MPLELKAAEGRCEEASLMSREFYIPCNQPATTFVYHSRDKRSYRMCDACAWHNIKNREGVEVDKDGKPIKEGDG